LAIGITYLVFLAISKNSPIPEEPTFYATIMETTIERLLPLTQLSESS
jgi:hypothetical protein